METNNNGGATPQPGAVKPLWEVLGNQEETVTIPLTQTPEQNQVKDTLAETEVIEQTPPTTEVPNTEPAKQEVKIETTEPIKVEEVVKNDNVLELTVDDIKNTPTKFADGTLQKYADELGFSIPEESLEVFKKTHNENFVLKSEVDKLSAFNKEKLFSTLSPKIATAFDLIEMGVPEELALNPTRAQDTYLAMSAEQLVREELLSRQNWTEEMADAKMEELASEPDKLKVQADIIRANLNNTKQEILQEQAQLVQKYQEQKQQAIQKQKVEDDNQFQEALAKEQAFLGLTLSKEYKDGLLENYKRGKYNEILSPAQAKVRAIILMESGDKFTKVALSKAKEEGKAEIVKKLSDVPIKSTQGGGQRQQLVNDNQENKGGFANMPSLYTQ